MEKHFFWAFFIIALFLGFVVGIVYGNSTITGYALNKPSFWQTLFGIEKQETTQEVIIACTDSDGGLNYNVKGTCLSNNNQFIDFCITNTILREFYCGANNCLSVDYNCSSGCYNGVCVGNIHIVWEDNRNISIPPLIPWNENTTIYYAKLDNEGNKIINDKKITEHFISSNNPKISIDFNNNIHIAWFDQRHAIGSYPQHNLDEGEIYYEKLNNNGNTLIDDKRLTYNPNASSGSGITIDFNNNIHIVWYDWRYGEYSDIYYKKLSNNGNIIINTTRLTFFPNYTSRRAVIAIDSNNNIHVVWEDARDQQPGVEQSEIYYKKLDNNGNTLIDDTRLSYKLQALFPKLAVDSNNNIHIVWMHFIDGLHSELVYKKLDNTGNTLINNTIITDREAQAFRSSIIVDSNNNIHIVWNDYREGNPAESEIYYTKLDNNGSTLIDDTKISDISAASFHPSIAVDQNNNLHIMWAASIGPRNDEIYYTKLDNNGSTLVPDKRLTYALGWSDYPSITVDSIPKHYPQQVNITYMKR